MSRFVIPVVCVLSVAAQTQMKTDVELARELLRRAGETALSATPTIAAASLLRIGSLTADWNKRDGVKYVEEAIQVAAAIPPDEARQIGGNIADRAAARLAALDLHKGLDLISRTPPGKRAMLLNTVVQGFLGEKNFVSACEALQQYGFDHPPVYRLISTVLRNMPSGSEDRALLFGRSVLALQSDPTLEFGLLLRENADGLSRTEFVDSIRAYSHWLLNSSQEKASPQELQEIGVSASKGDALFGSDMELELFRMLPWIKRADSTILNKIFEKYPYLKVLYHRYPNGLSSMAENGEGISISSTRWRADSNRTGGSGNSRGGRMSAQLAAVQIAKSDPSKAITMAAQLSSTRERAETLAQVAAILGPADPSSAELAIEKCLVELKELDNPEERIRVITILANAARLAGQVAVAKDLIRKSLGAIAEIYKLDNNEKSINKAPRTVWPSYYYAQRLAYIAGQVSGAEAEEIIKDLSDPELHLVASIEFAAALLKKEPPSSSGISINRVIK